MLKYGSSIDAVWLNSPQPRWWNPNNSLQVIVQVHWSKRTHITNAATFDQKPETRERPYQG